MISWQLAQAFSNSICNRAAISRLSHKRCKKEARQSKTQKARKGACEFLCPAWRMQPHLAGCLVSQKYCCVQFWHAEVASSAGLYGLWLPPQHRLACQLRFFISRERGASPHIWTSHFLCSPHRLLWVHEEEAQDFLHRWGPWICAARRIASLSLRRRFFSPGSQRWQNVHSAALASPAAAQGANRRALAQAAQVGPSSLKAGAWGPRLAPEMAEVD